VDLKYLRAILLDVTRFSLPVNGQAINRVHVENKQPCFPQRAIHACKGLLYSLQLQDIVQAIKPAGHQVELFVKGWGSHVSMKKLHLCVLPFSSVSGKLQHLGRAVNARHPKAFPRHCHSERPFATGYVQNRLRLGIESGQHRGQ
jgi:hypothetical protein